MASGVDSSYVRALIGFLGASIPITAHTLPVLHALMQPAESWHMKNLDTLLFPSPVELIPWAFVWLLTIVVVTLQSERNALVLSVFAIGLPATLAGLVDAAAFMGRY